MMTAEDQAVAAEEAAEKEGEGQPQGEEASGGSVLSISVHDDANTAESLT